MPKKAYLSAHFQPSELKHKYLTSKDPVEARRWGLIWKVAVGWTIKNSAIALGINYQYAKKNVKKYNELGAEGIKNRQQKSRAHRRGKQPLLNPEQWQKLIAALRQRPADVKIWTVSKVARWIEKETQRQKVSNQRGLDYLKKCGYSWQKPRYRPKKGEAQAQREFKKQLPLKVK
jgi:transposase